MCIFRLDDESLPRGQFDDRLDGSIEEEARLFSRQPADRATPSTNRRIP